MRILFIPYVLPPLHYPAALRNLKLLLGLASHDLEIDVCQVATDHYRHFGPDKLDFSLAEKLPSNVTYLPVQSPEKNFAFRTINANPTISKLFFPLTNPIKREWTWAAQRLLRKHDPSRYDAVVTMSQPHCNHLIGLWLKKRYGLPWIAFFSDPWIDNQYSSLRADSILRSFHAKMERDVMNHADLALFTSEETRRLLLKRYPHMDHKFNILPHCYVPEWYPKAKPRGADELITMLHCGNFYGPRSPQPLFRALANLEKKRQISRTLRVDLVGGMNPQDKSLLEQLGLGHFVRFAPTVPYLDALALQSEADWLLLIDAPSENGPNVFLPSKLIDYFGSAKPILGITPHEGASSRVLAEYNHPVHDVDDIDDIMTSCTRIANGWKPSIKSDSDKYNVCSIGQLFYSYLRKTAKLS